MCNLERVFFVSNFFISFSWPTLLLFITHTDRVRSVEFVEILTSDNNIPKGVFAGPENHHSIRVALAKGHFGCGLTLLGVGFVIKTGREVNDTMLVSAFSVVKPAFYCDLKHLNLFVDVVKVFVADSPLLLRDCVLVECVDHGRLHTLQRVEGI